MKSGWGLSKALIKRELLSYFSSPTGYVFIALFVFLSAVAAFWQESFFTNNLANLDQLNQVFPYLLVFFVPAITMSAWAEERKNGTDELLLTLPAHDFGIVLGKYLAALSIYTVSLVFSLSHVVVLAWLGSPDSGLMVSTYLGYWLMGAALLALGMVASLMTSNLTIAFILGSLLCAAPVFIDHAGVILTGSLQRFAESFSFRQQFRDLASGVVTLSSVAYFVTFAAVMLYINTVVLGRRHWPTQRGSIRLGPHYLVRSLALVVGVVSMTVLLNRIGGRIDVTAEQIHSLSDDTRRLIASLDPARPVFIHAYLSPQVPKSFLEARNNIVAVLREFDAVGQGRVHARIVETEKYTAEAREAQERFNIRAHEVPPSQQSAGSESEIFMGLAFSCSTEEFVIPFFDAGLPVEYELMRSIRVVSQAKRKKIGILQTGAKLFGGFDFESRRQATDWSIVAELRKQYEVVQVPPDQAYPEDLDVILVALPHSLSPVQLDRLIEQVKKGHPLLLLADPLPAFNPDLSPQQPPSNPFLPAAPKRSITNIKPLLDVLGVSWASDQIVWDRYNPHPQFRSLPLEVVFISAGNPDSGAFNFEEPTVSGLQEVVLIYAGVLKPNGNSSIAFSPLLRTGKDSGTTRWSRLVQSSLFGIQLATNLPHEPDPESYVVAARARGLGEASRLNAIVIADVDMMGEQFFQLRREGVETLRLDNVTFLLNAVDQLAGDESFIALRKRRPRHRTLEAVEARTRTYEEQRLRETREAQKNAELRLNEAQSRLDRAVETLRNRTDLDEQTKSIMIANQQKVESRRLNVARANIEDEKQRQIENSRAEMETSIRRIQNAIKLMAVGLPPVPAFLLFLMVSLRRLRREKLGVRADRLVLR
ncbi:MAG: Gldg family protein [Acidobacteriota bacterium]